MIPRGNSRPESYRGIINSFRLPHPPRACGFFFLRAGIAIVVKQGCVWRITDFPRISNSPHTGGIDGKLRGESLNAKTGWRSAVNSKSQATLSALCKSSNFVGQMRFWNPNRRGRLIKLSARGTAYAARIRGGNLFRRKQTSWRVAKPVCIRLSEQTLVAIQKFDQRSLDVIIPLVPRFEREVLKASDRFLFRHLRDDHSARSIESESNCQMLWIGRS